MVRITPRLGGAHHASTPMRWSHPRKRGPWWLGRPLLVLKVSLVIVILIGVTLMTELFRQSVLQPIFLGSTTPSLKGSETHSDEEQVSFTISPEDNYIPEEEDYEEFLLGESIQRLDERLNILVLYGDDWRHDSLGVAGTQPVSTPFLDRLAAQGIRFTENAVTSAVCWISRATYHSGQYLGRHQTPYLKDPVWYRNFEHTFPAVLNRAGYHVGHVGKWHFPEAENITADTFHFLSLAEGDHWVDFPDGSRVHITKTNELDAIRFLRHRPRHVPFVLTVAFFAPHAMDSEDEQYFPQPSSMSLYANMTLHPPEDVEGSWSRMPVFFTDDNEGRVRWRWRYDEPRKYDRMMKNYYRLISEVDATSCKIVAELERQGELDRTLVIFTTDNGLFHSEHGLADKWYPHAESIRVPLIIRDPRMPAEKRGTTEDALTLNVDLAPTILAAANATIPNLMQGRDMAQLYLNPTAKQSWRTDFFYEHPVLTHPDSIPASTALVSKEWKYMTWPDFGAEQLFHLRTDPREELDRASDPLYAEILKRLRLRHDELQQASR